MSPIEEARQNHLIAALPLAVTRRLLDHLEGLSLPQGQIIYEREARLKSIYFPTSCLLSEVVELESGSIVEALAVGRDGFVGTAALLDRNEATLKAIVQIEGHCLRMDITAFRSFLAEPIFRRTLNIYTKNAFALLAQSAACFAFHPLEERMARWLLQVRDAIGRDEIGLTQEFLAQMLAVQRPTASMTVQALAKAGLIEHRRSSVTIIDRAGLEAAACECYRAVSPLDLQSRSN